MVLENINSETQKCTKCEGPIKFKRQVPIGPYIVDFLCKEKMLIIKIDGWQHKEEFSGEKEKVRTVYLESQGYTILRFWNNQINTNLMGVFTEIDRSIQRKGGSSNSSSDESPHPNPLPKGEGVGILN